MKKKTTLVILLFAFCIVHYSLAQTLSPKAMPSSGGYFVAAGNSLSWTLGEPFYTTLQNGNSMLTQGFQQPYLTLKILNLKTYLEGLYTSGGQMTAVLYNSNPMGYPANACDSITVELHDANPPNNTVASVNTLLRTDGNAVAVFPSAALSGSYYIVVRHRNTLETWSKVPVSFSGSTVTFDFTSP